MGNDRFLNIFTGDHLHVVGQHGDADKHHAQQCAHDHQRLRGVLAARRLEGHDAVGDGLYTGKGSTAAGKGAQHQQDGERHQRVLEHTRLRYRLQLARALLPETDRQHQEHGGDKEVGGNGENRARLLDAAQVDDGDQRDEPQRDLTRNG